MRWLVVAVAACGSSAAPDASVPRALGMNDVSILVPLPGDRSEPVIAQLTPQMAPVNITTSLAIAGEIGPKTGETVVLDDYHVVALRFDPCPRDHVNAVCTDGDDGRLRLILQPLYIYQGEIAAHDIALHAFYPLPAADMPAIVDELRALAALQDAPVMSPLAQSPALLAGNAEYRARLQALVHTYATADRLVQLTVVGQNKNSAAFAWIFAGFEKTSAGWSTMRIPTLPPLEATRQTLTVGGGDTVYEMRPHVDFPHGMEIAMNGSLWALATDDERRIALEALAETENPTRHDTNDMPCMGCHVTTFLTTKRAAQAGVDPAQLARAFVSPYPLTVDTYASKDARVVRAFGYVTREPAISRRVANDTAYVLAELARRYGP